MIVMCFKFAKDNSIVDITFTEWQVISVGIQDEHQQPEYTREGSESTHLSSDKVSLWECQRVLSPILQLISGCQGNNSRITVSALAKTHVNTDVVYPTQTTTENGIRCQKINSNLFKQKNLASIKSNHYKNDVL